jgi:hypothetical protein
MYSRPDQIEVIMALGDSLTAALVARDSPSDPLRLLLAERSDSAQVPLVEQSGLYLQMDIFHSIVYILTRRPHHDPLRLARIPRPFIPHRCRR